MTDDELNKALHSRIGEVLWNVSNYPPAVQSRLMGMDVGPLREKVVAAAEAVFREHTAPTGDDRDELARVIAASRGYGFGWGQIRPLTDGAYRAVADAILSEFRLVRRPVQGEPVGNPEQLEPTDAQVKAGLDAYFGCDFYADYPNSVQYHEPSMRRALRAAFATGQGENRG